MTRSIKYLILVTLGTISLGGCANTIKGGPPKMAQLVKNDTSGRLANIRDAIKAECLELPGTELVPGKAKRDNLVLAYMLVVDEAYSDFEIGLLNEARGNNYAGTVLSLGISTAATLSGEAAAKTLSAIDTGIKGAKQAYDKDFLFNQTIPALQNQMRASRAKVRKRIYDRIGKDYGQWPTCLALQDLVAYEQAGTLTGALIALTETSANEKKINEQDAEEARISLTYDASGLADTLRTYWDANIDRIRPLITNEGLAAAGFQPLDVLEPDANALVLIDTLTGTADKKKLADYFIGLDPDSNATQILSDAQGQ